MTNEATQPQRVGATGLAPEPLPSLANFADEPGGAWPPGWYPAEVIAGYSAGGYQFVTADEAAKDKGKGPSRNFRLCLAITNANERRDDKGNFAPAGGSRKTFHQINYRVEDFSPQRLAQIKAMREERGRKRWVGAEDAQRTSIAIGQLGQIEKAFGFQLPKHPTGAINASVFVSQRVDVRLGVGEKGYNEVNAFAPLGTRSTR